MMRLLPNAVLSLVLLSPVRAAEPGLTDAAKALGLARNLADASAFLDRLTEAKGRPAARAEATPVYEGLDLSARFRIPRVEVRDHITNEVFGREVPGRRVDVSVKVDCIVRCTIDPGDIEISSDPDYPDTVIVKLPPIRVSADFAEDALADFEVDYGAQSAAGRREGGGAAAGDVRRGEAKGRRGVYG